MTSAGSKSRSDDATVVHPTELSPTGCGCRRVQVTGNPTVFWGLNRRCRQHAALTRLPPQQLKVIAWISYGYTNEEIAEELGVSVDTVKTHIRRLYTRLGASNRAHVVRLGFEAGALAPFSRLPDTDADTDANANANAVTGTSS